jgi:hypothetical protein
MKKKPTAKIIARAQDILSGTSRCCTCCMYRNPFRYAIKRNRENRLHSMYNA